MTRKLNSGVVNLLVALLAITGFGSGYGSSSYANTSSSSGGNHSREEQDCSNALKTNTIEAIEAFLRKYPIRENRPSVCGSLALNALGQFGGSGSSGPLDGGHGGHYGT